MTTQNDTMKTCNKCAETYLYWQDDNHRGQCKGNYGTNPEQQDPAFYTNTTESEVVWRSEGNPFYVVRNGEMRIIITNESGSRDVIRYTDALESAGIKTDKKLEELTEKGNAQQDVFDWINNPWFEIYSTEDASFFSEPMFTLDGAIRECGVLLTDYPDGLPY